MRVGVEHCIHTFDILAQRLLAQIRPGIDEKIHAIGADESGGAGALIAHIVRTAGGAVAADHRCAGAGAAAKHDHFQVHAAALAA